MKIRDSVKFHGIYTYHGHVVEEGLSVEQAKCRIDTWEVSLRWGGHDTGYSYAVNFEEARLDDMWKYIHNAMANESGWGRMTQEKQSYFVMPVELFVSEELLDSDKPEHYLDDS